MADFHPVQWAEAHPYLAGATVFGGGLAILWLFGFFGPNKGSESDGSGGSANLAGAYYAAEAQQAVVGGQIQMTTLQTAADTAQMALQTDAAVKINASNDTTAALIASSMYSADVTKAGYGADVAKTLGFYGAQTAQVQSADARMTQATHDLYNYQTNADALHAGMYNNFVNTIVAPELALGGGFANISTPGIGQFYIAGGPYSTSTPDAARAAGYSESAITRFFG